MDMTWMDRGCTSLLNYFEIISVSRFLSLLKKDLQPWTRRVRAILVNFCSLILYDLYVRMCSRIGGYDEN